MDSFTEVSVSCSLAAKEANSKLCLTGGGMEKAPVATQTMVKLHLRRSLDLCLRQETELETAEERKGDRSDQRHTTA